jgi:hypothetical protein
VIVIVVTAVTVLVLLTIVAAIAEARKRAGHHEGSWWERQVEVGRQNAEARKREIARRAAGRAKNRRNLPRL